VQLVIRRLAWVPALLAFAMTIASCADARDPVAISRADGTAAVALPFSVLNWDQAHARSIFLARQQLVRECMRARGFEYPVFDWVWIPELDSRYGITDRETAAKWGYAVPSSITDAEQVQQSAWAHYWDSLSTDEQAAADRALNGDPGDVSEAPGSGGDIFAETGGCNGAAMGTLHGSLDGYLEYEGLRSQLWDLRTQALVTSQKDERVLGAIRDWSQCMEGRGIQADSPLDIGERFVAHDDPAVEIATAIADVECKDAVDLVYRWSTVERELQMAAIQSAPHKLERFEELEADFLSNARDVLNGR